MQICSSFSKQKYSMIRYLSTLIFLIITACSNDGTNRNPYLQEISFRFEANLNLPSYSPLTNTGSAVLIQNATAGTKGVFVINAGFDQFRAFEASCPNHAPNECSTMTLNGQLATCSLKSSYELSGVKEIALAPSFDGHHYSFIGFTAYSNDS